MTHPVGELRRIASLINRGLTDQTVAWPRKGFLEGAHRLLEPAETLERLSPGIERIGVTRVADVTGLDVLGIPVVMVCRPNSRSLAVYQGKGLTLDAAKVSGLMESFERWHGEECRGQWRIASRRSLERRHAVVDTTRLPRNAGKQFSPDQDMPWVRGYDLMARATTWLPYELVHFDQTECTAPGMGVFPNTSTGLAVGNDLAEALVHGICEVIERDQTTLWRLLPLERQVLTRIDQESIDSPTIRSLLQRIADAGLLTAVWSARVNLGVPVFVCRIFDEADAGQSPLILFDGSGCHPSREIALLRAITEAVQGRLTYIVGARDDLLPHHYRRPTRSEFNAERSAMRRHWPAIPFDAAPSFLGASSLDDLVWLFARLAAAGISTVLGVDLSHEQIGMAAVRVVVPELEDGEEMPAYVPRQRARRAFWGLV